MSCDIVINGQVPQEAFAVFATAQAKAMGIRGYISQEAEDLWKGVLQGQGKVIEAFKKFIMAAAEYVDAIKEFVIKNIKAIEEYTYETFVVNRK